MAEKQFQIAVAAIILVSLAGIIIVLFSSAQQAIDPDILQSLGSVTVNNVTSQGTYTGGPVYTNNTNLITNGTSGFRLIRNTPQVTCNSVYIKMNHSATAASRTMKLDARDFKCNTTNTGLGKLFLILHGNSTNGSSNGPRGIGYLYNVSYTAKLYDASYNVTKKLQQGYREGGALQEQYYVLIILSIVLGLGLLFLGFKYGGGGGEGFSGFSRPDIGGNPLDSFER